MPGKNLPAIRDQSASDLLCWTYDVLKITHLLRKAEISFDMEVHNIQPACVLLTTASKLLQARAYAEAGRCRFLSGTCIRWSWMLQRLSHPPTPVPEADAILTETCEVGQELGPARPSWREAQLYLLLSSRQAGAMCTKLDVLVSPERLEYARFPNTLRKDVNDAIHHLYASMVLLDDLLNTTYKTDERRGRRPMRNPQD